MSLVLDGIHAGYGRVQVLHDVSVSVQPGSRLFPCPYRRGPGLCPG